MGVWRGLAEGRDAKTWFKLLAFGELAQPLKNTEYRRQKTESVMRRIVIAVDYRIPMGNDKSLFEIRNQK